MGIKQKIESLQRLGSGMVMGSEWRFPNKEETVHQ